MFSVNENILDTGKNFQWKPSFELCILSLIFKRKENAVNFYTLNKKIDLFWVGENCLSFSEQIHFIQLDKFKNRYRILSLFSILKCTWQ